MPEYPLSSTGYGFEISISGVDLQPHYDLKSWCGAVVPRRVWPGESKLDCAPLQRIVNYQADVMDKIKNTETKVARLVSAQPLNSRERLPLKLWLNSKRPVRRAENDEENSSFVRGYN